MAYFEKRTTSDGKAAFRVRVRLKGYPEQTATFERKTDAKRWAQTTEAAIREGRHFKVPETRMKTVSDMLERYIKEILPQNPRSARSQLQQLEWWKTDIGGSLLSDLTQPLLAEKRDQLARGLTPRGKPRTPATVNRYLAALSHACTIAVKEWQWMSDNPVLKVRKLKEPRGRSRYLNEDERKRLLEAAKQSDHAMLYPVVMLGLATGMRKSEIMKLTWDRVNLELGRVTLEKTKNDEPRSIRLAPPAMEAVLAHRRTRALNTPLLFPSEELPNQPVELKKHWYTALEVGAIEDFHFHDLRHSTGSYLAMSGATLLEIAEVLGHKTLSMVKRYAHLSAAHSAEVVDRMAIKFLM